MARRHRRRGFRGIMQFPSLGGFRAFNSSVNSTDVLVGGVIGLAGAIGAQAGLTKLRSAYPSAVPDFAVTASPTVGAALFGGTAYLVQRKRNRTRATGHAIGAAAAGLAVQAYNVLVPMIQNALAGSSLSAYGLIARSPQRLRGLIANSPQTRVGPGAFQGLIVNNPQSNLARLAAFHDVGDVGGIEELAYE